MLSTLHLKVLAAVARTGSVTEAARELHYSQSSVSHHLARLEAATGAQVVARFDDGSPAMVERTEGTGRGIVLGTPPEACASPAEAVAQRALEGFVRSVGKEFGRGTTAQLVYVAPGEDAVGVRQLRAPVHDGLQQPVGDQRDTSKDDAAGSRP